MKAQLGASLDEVLKRLSKDIGQNNVNVYVQFSCAAEASAGAKLYAGKEVQMEVTGGAKQTFCVWALEGKSLAAGLAGGYGHSVGGKTWDGGSSALLAYVGGGSGCVAAKAEVIITVKSGNANKGADALLRSLLKK